MCIKIKGIDFTRDVALYDNDIASTYDLFSVARIQSSADLFDKMCIAIYVGTCTQGSNINENAAQ